MISQYSILHYEIPNIHKFPKINHQKPVVCNMMESNIIKMNSWTTTRGPTQYYEELMPEGEEHMGEMGRGIMLYKRLLLW